jgi:glutaredoxin 3
MAAVKIYTTQDCGYCRQAKQLLQRKGIPFEEIDVTDDPETRDWLVRETGRRTVPQVFVGQRALGGYSDLLALEQEGRLDTILRDRTDG